MPMSEKAVIPGVIAPPPLIFLGFLFLGWGLSWLLPEPGLPWLGEARRYLAFGLIALGLVMDAAAVGLFHTLGTRPEPWKPTTALATDGLYRLTRNPMYLGFALIHIGLALALNSLWALAMLMPCLMVVDRAVIAREERYLAARFGAEYDTYRKRVRRWL